MLMRTACGQKKPGASGALRAPCVSDCAAPAKRQRVWNSLALRSPVLQPKLAVSSPGDAHEREADRVADAVAGHGSPQSHHAPVNETPGMTAPPVVDEVLRSPGTPIEPSTRDFMESRFGHDFGSVRLHTGPKAAESARAVNALAYTVGSDVVFGEGQQATHGDAGRRVLAHELTHVVQQSTGLGRKVLQRWTLNSCNQAQSVYVEDAFAKSYDNLSKAARRLAQKPTTDRVKQAMWLAFRSDSEETAEKLRPQINLLKQKITSATVTCSETSKNPECKNDTGYHSRASSDYGMIYLCMPAFSDKNPTEQANTLTHEAAHKYLDVRDTGYFGKGCEETQARRPKGDEEGKDSGTAGDNPFYRFNNADSYTCFVHFLTQMGTEDLAKKAADYRGDNLALTADESWIYTKTATPKRATFKITGLPENSGFKVKWTVIAGEDRFRVTAMRDERINTSTYDEDPLEVFIPNDVRAKLEEKKVSEVILQCEIQLYRPVQGQPEPPIVTKTMKVNVHSGQDPLDSSLQ